MNPATPIAAAKRKPTALVADDDFVSRMALREALKGMGIDVVAEVQNGREALDKAAQLLPDMVCLDIEMPEMDGLAVLQQLRTDNKRLVAVIVTASPTAQHVRQALKGDADGIVTKPFNRDKIETELRAAIRRRRPKMAQAADQ